jgi:hypothetical protein
LGQVYIADSDNSWAAIRYVPEQGQQPEDEVRHEENGSWAPVSDGTSQVACSGGVPSNVQADFSNLSGFGPC